MSASKVEKTRARLQKRIEEGSYYEAHQQLRVLSQRYVKAENYEAAIDILFSGAQALLKAGQGGSGGDLCTLLLEVYQTAELKPDATTKARIFTLLSLIPLEEPSRKRFIKEAVAWSAKYGEIHSGDPELHHFIGSLYAQEDDAYDAEKHLLVGTKASADVLANLLYRWYSDAGSSHAIAAHYLARAVLPYLLLRNIRDATRVYDLFTKQLVANDPSIVVQEVQSSTSEARVFPELPLVNFLGLLLLAIQRGAADLFRSLKTHYSAQLKEVHGWDDPLEQIGEMYFGIRIQRPTNLFDMMGSLFGGAPIGSGSSSSAAGQVAIPPAVELD
ncbi:hypothetical protein BDZ91DRAFT_715089 [Kalaharituber pfeilii]|nr:hypothetical protein BDZ91DRAFT_715089 [Kalaharituber pfeilii]